MASILRRVIPTDICNGFEVVGDAGYSGSENVVVLTSRLKFKFRKHLSERETYQADNGKRET